MTKQFIELVLRRASELYGFDARIAEEVPGHEGGRNRVFRLGGERVLRISGLADRSFEDYLAETEYVRYLAQNGASVSDVCASASGNLVEKCEEGGEKCGEKCVISVFVSAKGDQIAEHGYRYREGAPLEEYFFNTGKVLGKMHALSVNYHPVHPRFDFFDKYNEAYFDRLIPDSLSCAFLGDKPIGREVKRKLNELLDRLRALPRDDRRYGMIHFDYSDGNYNIDYSNGNITVFDFDNCRTGWYLYDLANLWTHGVGWIAWNGDTEERARYMERYMNSVLNGYRTEMPLDDGDLSNLPLMIEAVRMENIIDEFEVEMAENGKIECDGEQAYRLKGLLEDVPFMGFLNDDYDPESPFDLDV